MMKLLVTGAFSEARREIPRYEDLGFEVDFHNDESTPLKSYDYEAIICNGLFLYNDIERFDNLRFIQLTSAGTDRVPLDEITRRGIILKTARGVYNTPMAEWALMMVLSRYKNLPMMLDNQRNHRWEKNRHSREIIGRRVAVLGAGSVGQTVAATFRAIGARVDGFDVTSVDLSNFEHVYSIQDIDRCIGDYDIVISTLPLNDHTYHRLDYPLLSRMKQDGMLVNLSRGKVVDEAGLIRFLQEREDIYAALDVFETEPLPSESPLWSRPNVLATPHNSFIGDNNGERLSALIYNNLQELLR